MKNKNLVIGIAALVAVAVVLVLYFSFRGDTAPTGDQAGPGAAEPASPEARQSLGGQILEKSQNPVQGKLPTANPTTQANPVEGLYKNPFE